jgi:ATP-dependent protease ClpP protease subunit
LPNWGEVLQEVNQESAKGLSASDNTRRKYLGLLATHTGRNVIGYYSGFLSKPGIQLLDINDEDLTGFMMAVHKLDRAKGLDLILHTPGGSIASTESLVNYLHIMFNHDMRVIVPQIAMSAGTMIACSSKEIVMGKQSSLGPIDPQLRGIPAQGVINEFKQALKEYKEDKDSLQIWQFVIQQYRPTFLGQCQQANEWTRTFVSGKLKSVMFSGDPDAEQKSARIVDSLSDTDEHKSHERHIPMSKCIEMGLRIKPLEDDAEFQDLVLTVHHCYMYALMNTTAYKIIENHLGVRFVKVMTSTKPTA